MHYDVSQCIVSVHYDVHIGALQLCIEKGLICVIFRLGLALQAETQTLLYYSLQYYTLYVICYSLLYYICAVRNKNVTMYVVLCFLPSDQQQMRRL